MKGAKRTMKDVKVGDKVRYVKPMPEGTWMMCAWGDEDGLVVGNSYEVLNVNDADQIIGPNKGHAENSMINSLGRQGLAIVGTKFEFYVDVECFELI